MALDFTDQFNKWYQAFKQHDGILPLSEDDIKMPGQKENLTALEGKTTQSFYSLTLRALEGLVIPEAYRNKVAPSGQARPPADFQYFIQARVSMFSYKKGFFGRTYIGKLIQLDGVTFKPLEPENDWALMYTKLTDIDVHAVLEYTLQIKQIIREPVQENKSLEESKSQDKKDDLAYNTERTFRSKERLQIVLNQSLGMALITLFKSPMPIKTDLFIGTPRQLFQGNFQTMTKSGAINFEFKEHAGLFDKLKPFIPSECFIGQHEVIPGLKTTLPSIPSDFKPASGLSERKTIYLKGISIDNLDLYDKSVDKSLAERFKSDTVTIVERKLCVNVHNTWKSFGNNVLIFTKDLEGKMNSSGTLLIPDFCLHQLNAIIFKLFYKADFKNARVQKDICIAQSVYLPTLIQSNTDMLDVDLQLQMQSGPSISDTGDQLWDINARLKPLLLNASLSTSQQQVKTEAQINREQEMQIRLKQMQDSVQNADITTITQEQQKLMVENLKLKQQNDDLTHKLQQEKVVEKVPDEKDIKKYFLKENAEIEGMIKNIMAIQFQQKKGGETQFNPSLMAKNPETLESLLRFLIYIVLHQEQVVEGPDQEAHKTLLEMLKQDEHLQETIFGHLNAASKEGGGNKGKGGIEEMGPDDRLAMLRMGLNKHMNNKVKLTQEELSLELEQSDIFQANNLTFKFIAFKTPSSMPPLSANSPEKMPMPKSLFFTFKFYTFQTVQTEVALLKTANQIESWDVANKSQPDAMRLSTSYFLVYKDLLKYFMTKQKPALEQVLDRGIQHTFDINPATTKNHEEHIQLAKYLNNQLLTIELWNAEDQAHFGTCKIPMVKLMRQGQPHREYAAEFEAYDPVFNSWVGSLQLLIKNEGRRVATQDMPLPPTSSKSQRTEDEGNHVPVQSFRRNKKRIYSKPLDEVASKTQQNPQIDDLLASLPQMKPVQLATVDDEDQRKKLRIQRLRQQNVQQDLNVTVLKDETACNTEKQEMLEKIQIIREAKKRQMLNSLVE